MIVHYSAGLFLGGFAMLHQNNPRELFMDVAFGCIFDCEKEKMLITFVTFWIRIFIDSLPVS